MASLASCTAQAGTELALKKILVDEIVNSQYKERKLAKETGSLLPGTHILIWLLARGDASWLQGEAPKSSELRGASTKVSHPSNSSGLSYPDDTKMKKVSMIHTFFVSQIFSTLKVSNWDGTSEGPLSERVEHDKRF